MDRGSCWFRMAQRIGWLSTTARTVRIDGKSGVATVTHLNRDGRRLWSIDLPPAA
ncbi:MAG: hypothetical protein JNL10_17185 [Verrucomicrobiales bacterium]|nr:hypothetical protein [Verrucomicrobiales bacterium]